jgi:hypothetical protein
MVCSFVNQWRLHRRKEQALRHGGGLLRVSGQSPNIGQFHDLFANITVLAKTPTYWPLVNFLFQGTQQAAAGAVNWLEFVIKFTGSERIAPGDVALALELNSCSFSIRVPDIYYWLGSFCTRKATRVDDTCRLSLCMTEIRSKEMGHARL